MYEFKHDGKSYGVILPPKCATRSYEHALRKLGAKSYGGRHGYPPAVRQRQDVLLASIRHPCDVLVSWFFYERAGQRSGRSFARYVGHIVSGGNAYLAKSTLPGAEFATQYLRYEDGPSSELDAFLVSVGREPFANFEHRGKAPSRMTWKTYYSQDLIDVVSEKYQHDFTKYGYEAVL